MELIIGLIAAAILMIGAFLMGNKNGKENRSPTRVKELEGIRKTLLNNHLGATAKAKAARIKVEEAIENESKENIAHRFFDVFGRKPSNRK